MSYELYCYRSTIGKPDLEEAQSAIELDEDERITETDRLEMRKIAHAIIASDRRLELFEFDYAQIAESQALTIEEARASIDFIEINTPAEDETPIQFLISKNVVAVSFGFGMTEAFIDRIMGYVDTICEQTGYFLYDPQAESVSDPCHAIPLTDEESGGWANNDEIDFLDEPKPWWKFW